MQTITITCGSLTMVQGLPTNFRCQDFVASPVYWHLRHKILSPFPGISSPYISLQIFGAKLKTIMIWNLLPELNRKGKVRWDLYCRQGFTQRSTTHNVRFDNFGSLTHPPYQFQWVSLDMLFELKSKPVSFQTTGLQNNHGLLTSKRCANATFSWW